MRVYVPSKSKPSLPSLAYMRDRNFLPSRRSTVHQRDEVPEGTRCQPFRGGYFEELNRRFDSGFDHFEVPILPGPGADGGPLRYRVVHRVSMWRPGERPRLERRVLEGDPGLAL
jgi:hypothetical protein